MERYSLLIFDAGTDTAVCEGEVRSALTPEQIVDRLGSAFRGVLLARRGIAAHSRDLPKTSPWYRASLDRD